LSVRQISVSQAAILGGVLIYAFGYIAGYYYCLLALFCLWDELPIAKLKSVVRCGVLFAIPAASALLIIMSTVATASYDQRVYLAASFACLAACSLLFWDLLGSQIRALLDESPLALRRWNLDPMRPYWTRTNPLALPMRKVLVNSLTKLVIPRPKL
jgi:hypothetical protein